MNIESLPPLFNQKGNHPKNADLDESIEDLKDSDPIPVIDLRCLNQDELGLACKDWGLFYLVNHGVPSDLVTQIQDQARKIFTLPFDYKQSIIRSPLSYFWGTTARTTSGGILRSSKSINWVEVINFPVTQLSQFKVEDDPLLDSFRLLLDVYARHLARVGRTIFEAIAKTLNLDMGQTESYLSESTGFIRVHRYPRISEGNQAWGVGVHTDSTVVSILNQDQVGGLEVLRENKWFPVHPIPNTFIVNLGDMMQAMSNDKYVSVKHRVRVNKQQDRISINYFVFPDPDCIIQSTKYKPFTYKDFHAQAQKDIETGGFKIGLQGFKLSS